MDILKTLGLTITPEQNDINEKFDRKLSNLTYNEDNPETRFTRTGEVSLSEDGKICAVVRKTTRIYRWIDVCTYHKYDSEVYAFLWKLVNWLNKEGKYADLVDVTLSSKKDRIDVKVTFASKSRIVGKLPDDIYNEIKDRSDLELLEARLDFIEEPGDLNISIYEHGYDVIKFDNWK